jgi:DNA-binding response OmpR family regulator
MPDARVIVCEKTGRWATALRRAFHGLQLRVVETRSLAECWRELEQSPASLVALEFVAGNRETLLRRLLDLRSRYRRAQAIVLAERGLEPLEWVLREAGAVDVVFSPRSLAPTARLAQRYVQSVPPADIDIREAVWRRLPFAVGARRDEC